MIDGDASGRVLSLPPSFSTPDEQFEAVDRWNHKFQMGIPARWFCALGPPPVWPANDHSYVVLEPALPAIDGVPGHVRTARALWKIITTQHPRFSEYPKFDWADTTLFPKVVYEPGLRWRVLDLVGHWERPYGTRPEDVKPDFARFAHIDALAALAHHPGFVRKMDGTTVPDLWLTGFRLGRGGDGWHSPVIEFRRSVEEVCLNVRWASHRFPHLAIPLRRVEPSS